MQLIISIAQQLSSLARQSTSFPFFRVTQSAPAMARTVSPYEMCSRRCGSTAESETVTRKTQCPSRVRRTDRPPTENEVHDCLEAAQNEPWIPRSCTLQGWLEGKWGEGMQCACIPRGYFSGGEEAIDTDWRVSLYKLSRMKRCRRRTVSEWVNGLHLLCILKLQMQYVHKHSVGTPF